MNIGEDKNDFNENFKIHNKSTENCKEDNELVEKTLGSYKNKTNIIIVVIFTVIISRVIRKKMIKQLTMEM